MKNSEKKWQGAPLARDSRRLRMWVGLYARHPRSVPISPRLRRLRMWVGLYARHPRPSVCSLRPKGHPRQSPAPLTSCATGHTVPVHPLRAPSPLNHPTDSPAPPSPPNVGRALRPTSPLYRFTRHPRPTACSLRAQRAPTSSPRRDTIYDRTICALPRSVTDDKNHPHSLSFRFATGPNRWFDYLRPTLPLPRSVNASPAAPPPQIPSSSPLPLPKSHCGQKP